MNRHSWKKRLQNLVLVLLSLNLSLLGLSSMVWLMARQLKNQRLSRKTAYQTATATNRDKTWVRAKMSMPKAAIAMDAKTGQILYQKTRENVIRLLPPLRFSHWPSLKKIFRLIS